jgi:hypothetical protein
MGSAATFQIRRVGGTRHMTVAYEGGVSVLKLGCYRYSETATSRMLHPNRLERDTHHGLLAFGESQPVQRHGERLNCHERGAVPLVTPRCGREVARRPRSRP